MQSILQKATGIGPTPVHPEHLHGLVAVVTGGALGIGYEVSRALARAGCKVIMVNRKEEQGVEATGPSKKNPPIGESLPRLDFLVLSAGINTNKYGLDADGIDRHFGVNYLGHFYVCNLLWPLLRKTSKLENAVPPRIVFESSEMHRFAPSQVHFASLEEINDSTMDPTNLYGRTKLAMILLAKYGLAGKVIKENNDRIYATSVHPGAVNTAMQQQWKDAYPGLTGKLISSVSIAFGRDVEQGSYSALWALTAPKIVDEDMNGWYFSDPDQPGKETAQASDPALGTALWELSHRIIKEKLGEDALVDWNAS